MEKKQKKIFFFQEMSLKAEKGHQMLAERESPTEGAFFVVSVE